MKTMWKEAEDRGFWLAKELAGVSGLSVMRIRQLLTEGVELRGQKIGQYWMVSYTVGVNWLKSRE